MLKNKSKGFSLVELIVVIAILVVFAAVLIPSLLQYTENSRAQKDESAMDEVVNAFQLAMADQDCFDEMLQYSCTNNYLTYSDSSGNYGQQINDGEFWAPDGSGRATTVTFNPEVGVDGKTVYKMDTAILNDMTYGNGSIAQGRVMEGTLIEDNQCYFKNAGSTSISKTYASVKQAVGETILNDSQTYRNSSFTVFIKFSQKDSVTVADVYGQFNGTNVHDGAEASKGTGTTEYESDSGSAMTTVGGGTTNAVFTQTSLQGTGAFSGVEDYKSKDNFEQLSKDYEFKFYSSVKLAADDINSGNIGSLADVENENDAIAGIYIDDNGKHTIVVLKDNTINATITITSETTIDLNGHNIKSTASRGVQSSAKLKIIGNGGAFTTTPNTTTASALCIYSTEHIEIEGGTYVLNALNNESNAFCIRGDKGINISNADINILGPNIPASIAVYSAGDALVARNCNVQSFTVENDDSSFSTTTHCAGFYSTSENNKSSLINCNINVSGSCAIGYFDEIIGGTHSSRLYTYFFKGDTPGNIVVKDVNINDMPTPPEGAYSKWYWSPNGIAMNTYQQNIYIINCNFKYTNKQYVIRLQGANGEKDCNLYFSNTKYDVQLQGEPQTKFCTANGLGTGHKVYIGKGCNITANNFLHPEQVTETNETYKAP